MSWHSIGGHLQLFYGDATATGSPWTPAAAGTGKYWTVMVFEIEHGDMGKTGLADITHIPDRDLAGRKIALVGNWTDGASSLTTGGPSLVVGSSAMLSAKTLAADLNVRTQLHTLFGAASTNVLSLLGSLAPPSITEDALGPDGATGGSIVGLGSGSLIQVGSLGKLKVP